MMKRLKKTTILRLIILVTGLLLVITTTGCIDSVAADCQAEHLRLGEIARQQLQYGPSYMINAQQGTMYHQ
ncbi:MAG: hypothetical protein JW837_17085 [Sedimentisphaerales bacterium]|nr:hypothetical protein [Sedimentisphaerales bacterium]